MISEPQTASLFAREQFRMTRQFARHPEIVRRPHEPSAEQIMPHPVRHHTSRQRMLRVRQPASELQTTTLIGRNVIRLRQLDDFWEPARHFRSRASDVASLQQRYVDHLATIQYAHRQR